jgi:hypothetical protein
MVKEQGETFNTIRRKWVTLTRELGRESFNAIELVYTVQWALLLTW